MIWATVSFRSCFSRLYRTSPSLDAKNIISLISVLTIWWCPCVESSLVLLEEGVCYDQCVLFAKLWAFALLHSVLQGQIYLLLQVFLTSCFCIPVPYNEKDIFFRVLVLVGLHRPFQLQPLQCYWLGHRLGLLWLNGLPWKRTEIILSFLRVHPGTAFWTPFLLRDSCPQ